MHFKEARWKKRRTPLYMIILGTLGLWVSESHDWSVLVSGPSISYQHDIGDMRPFHGIWAFGHDSTWHLVHGI